LNVLYVSFESFFNHIDVDCHGKRRLFLICLNAFKTKFWKKEKKKMTRKPASTSIASKRASYSLETKQQALELVEEFVHFLEKRVLIKNADIFIQIAKEFASNKSIPGKDKFVSKTLEEFIEIGANVIVFLPFQTKSAKPSSEVGVNLGNDEKIKKHGSNRDSVAFGCLFFDFFKEQVEGRHLKKLKRFFQAFCDGNAEKEVADFVKEKSQVMSIIPSRQKHDKKSEPAMAFASSFVHFLKEVEGTDLKKSKHSN
jgi:hypothetical protein